MNPFENQEGMFLVLRNGEEQFSLWPTFAAVPDGWQVMHGPAGRAECVEHVERAWVDMRPRSLRVQMSGTGT